MQWWFNGPKLVISVHKSFLSFIMVKDHTHTIIKEFYMVGKFFFKSEHNIMCTILLLSTLHDGPSCTK
jgi:hypothetical protein